MEKENPLDREKSETNLKLNEKMNDDSYSPNGIDSAGSVTETNLKLQDAFYGESHEEESVPSYVTTETAAVKTPGD